MYASLLTRIDTRCLDPLPAALIIAGTLFVGPLRVYPAPLLWCKRVSFDMFHVDHVAFNCLLSLLAQQARNCTSLFGVGGLFLGVNGSLLTCFALNLLDLTASLRCSSSRCARE